jgi:hypothetical protein
MMYSGNFVGGGGQESTAAGGGGGSESYSESVASAALDGSSSVASSYFAGLDISNNSMDDIVNPAFERTTLIDQYQQASNHRRRSHSTTTTKQAMNCGPITSNINVDVTPQSLDALLAKELNDLTFQERQGIDEEIHGVYNSTVHETPEFVNEKIAAFEREIVKIRYKPAYDRAVQLNSSYIYDVERFYLPFLRAELFHEQEAASRMVKYLSFIFDLYGEVGLTRPIYFSDMSTQDIKFLKVGVFQLLPCRDRSGRRIFGIFDDIPPETPVKSRVGLYFAYTIFIWHPS